MTQEEFYQQRDDIEKEVLAMKGKYLARRSSEGKHFIPFDIAGFQPMNWRYPVIVYTYESYRPTDPRTIRNEDPHFSIEGIREMLAKGTIKRISD